MLNKTSKIFIAGHKGLVGSSTLKILKKKFSKIFTIDKKKLDLRDEKKVEKFFKKNNFDFVIICAAKVGGIYANYTRPVEFIYDNLKIQNNLIMSSYKYRVKRLIFLGSSCIYPKKTKNPINENQLLGGKLEKTNESYAIAKIAGIKLCEALYRQHNFDSVSVMPTNIYGLNDNFDIKNSHVIPGIFTKILLAKKNKKKSTKLLGTGKPKREFLFSDDLAKAIYILLKSSRKKLKKICKDSYPLINVGSGKEITIKNLAKKIANICNYKGKIIFQNKSWDGTFRKKLDSSKIGKLKWKAEISLDDGLKLIKNKLTSA